MEPISSHKALLKALKCIITKEIRTDVDITKDIANYLKERQNFTKMDKIVLQRLFSYHIDEITFYLKPHVIPSHQIISITEKIEGLLATEDLEKSIMSETDPKRILGILENSLDMYPFLCDWHTLSGETLLYLCCKTKSLEAVKYIFSRGCAPDQANLFEPFSTPLLYSVRNDLVPIVDFLLDSARCDPTICEMNGICPLYYANHVDLSCFSTKAWINYRNRIQRDSWEIYHPEDTKWNKTPLLYAGHLHKAIISVGNAHHIEFLNSDEHFCKIDLVSMSIIAAGRSCYLRGIFSPQEMALFDKIEKIWQIQFPYLNKQWLDVSKKDIDGITLDDVEWGAIPELICVPKKWPIDIDLKDYTFNIKTPYGKTLKLSGFVRWKPKRVDSQDHAINEIIQENSGEIEAVPLDQEANLSDLTGFNGLPGGNVIRETSQQVVDKLLNATVDDDPIGIFEENGKLYILATPEQFEKIKKNDIKIENHQFPPSNISTKETKLSLQCNDNLELFLLYCRKEIEQSLYQNEVASIFFIKIKNSIQIEIKGSSEAINRAQEFISKLQDIELVHKFLHKQNATTNRKQRLFDEFLVRSLKFPESCRVIWNRFVESLLTNLEQEEQDANEKFQLYLSSFLTCVYSSLLTTKDFQRLIQDETAKIDKKVEMKKLELMLFEEFKIVAKTEIENTSKFIGKEMESYKFQKLCHQLIQVTEATPLAEYPSLILRLHVYIATLRTNLPMFFEAEQILATIQNHDVCAVNTGTGSGKSTILPALLFIAGYKKILVTQPRRFPCSSLFKRMESTFGPNLVGWAVSGEFKNTHNPICYYTDGLFKEMVIAKPYTLPYDVIVLDEVHERGINIDLLIAHMATILPTKNLKVVLCSATLDKNILEPFRNSTKDPKWTLYNGTMVKSPYQVTTCDDYREMDPLIAVINLSRKIQRGEQVLCFLPTTGLVKKLIQIMEKLTGTIAYPLYAQQPHKDQAYFLENGSVFFSTNIAETSLTFPNLKYVVDSGNVNMSDFDVDRRINALVEKDASKSSMMQRKGRLGRTCPGVYYPCYPLGKGDMNPIPQIAKMNLIDVDFALRRAGIKKGIWEYTQVLPTCPSNKHLDVAFDFLTRLGVIDEKFGNTRETREFYLSFPNIGGVRFALGASVAFQTGCASDYFKLCAILMNLPINPGALIDAIPRQLKAESGDWESLYNLMNYALSNGSDVIPAFQVFLQRSIDRFHAIITECSLVKELKVKCYQRVSNPSQVWPKLLVCLLKGFPDHVFISEQPFDGKKHDYNRLYPLTLAKTSPKSIRCKIGKDSLLHQDGKEIPHLAFLAKDIFASSAMRTTVQVSILGKISDLSVLDFQIERKIILGKNEALECGKPVLELKGKAGSVIAEEINIRTRLRKVESVELLNLQKLDEKDEKNDQINKIMTIMKDMPFIFNPIRMEYLKNHQLELKMNTGKAEFVMTGREAQRELFINDMKSFTQWVRHCSVVRPEKSEVTPRVMSHEMRLKYPEIEPRIAKVTDENRTIVDIWEAVHGPKATRESRMEVVAWVAVTHFDGKLEGGFVRDWIVGGRKNYLPNVRDWIVSDKNGRDAIAKEIAPSDLDIHLPFKGKKFDLDKFLDELYAIGIHVLPDDIIVDPWRWYIIFDRKIGPFSIDIIKPHIVFLSDRVDFDVSNLYLKKNYTKDIGLRVDTTGPHPDIQLEDIVDNIMKKECIQLRRDHAMNQRVKKMTEIRGWTVHAPEEKEFIPYPTTGACLKKIASDDPLFVKIKKDFDAIGSQVVKIERISNESVDMVFEGFKRVIAESNNGDANDQNFLYHGTNSELGALGIQNSGFDNRFWKLSGAFGAGAYFANKLEYSYSMAGGKNGATKYIFYCQVILGKVQQFNVESRNRTCPDKGFHSVEGLPGAHNHWGEFIVYNYGQAKPTIKVTCI